MHDDAPTFSSRAQDDGSPSIRNGSSTSSTTLKEVPCEPPAVTLAGGWPRAWPPAHLNSLGFNSFAAFGEWGAAASASQLQAMGTTLKALMAP